MDGADFKDRSPTEDDYDHIVKPGTEVWVDGKMAAGFYLLEEDAAELTEVCKALPYVFDYRTSGMRTRACIFGWRPREPLRKDYCASASLKSKQPHAWAMLDRWGRVAERYYRESRRDVWEAHRALIDEKVNPAWCMEDSLFTSGIVNLNTSHVYHKDFGNFQGTWNSMIVLSNDIRGGETVVPALRCAFQYDTFPAVLTFPAEGEWHGVMPLQTLGRDGFRISIVFYSMTGMCHCGTPKEEVQRIRRKQSEREARRTDVEATASHIAESSKPAAAQIEQLRKEGKLAEFGRTDLTLDERIAQVERAAARGNAAAKSVLKRLLKKKARQDGS